MWKYKDFLSLIKEKYDLVRAIDGSYVIYDAVHYFSTYVLYSEPTLIFLITSWFNF